MSLHQTTNQPAGIATLGPVTFHGDIQGAEDISAVDAVGDFLVLGSDESNFVQLLMREGDAYRVTGDPVVLNPAAEEIDIEGIAHDAEWVYVLGSHAWKRKKVDADKKYKKNREALETVSREKDRERVCRFRLAPDGSASAVEETSLRAFLDSHPALEPLAKVPSKENGIDLEGLAVHAGRLYAGFRSPVLRGGFVPVARFPFADPVAGAELLYLSLDGRGVRDIARVGDGFLVLAGPSGEAAMSSRVYFWDGNDCLPGADRPAPMGVLKLLGDLPADATGAAEALSVLGEGEGGYEVLVVFDGVANGNPTRYRVPRP